MIPKDRYLEYSSNFKLEELALQEELLDWLPDDIIDCHTHSNLPEHSLVFEPKIWGHPMSTFPSFTIEESRQIHALFYPQKRVRCLRFALPFKGIDHKEANVYLLDKADVSDRVALCGIPTDVDYTVKMLRTGLFAGLKMYYFFFNPPAEKIYDFFPPEILEESQSLGIPIILHPPKIITECHDLHKLIKDFPKLLVMICHLGLPEMLIPGLDEVYKDFSKYENIFMDTAFVRSFEVVAMAIKNFGTERILFGSDEPLHMIRGRSYIHPRLGARLIAEYPYHWVDRNENSEFGYLAQGAVHIIWQTFSAVKTAIQLLPPSVQDMAKKLIFRENAKRIFGFDE